MCPATGAAPTPACLRPPARPWSFVLVRLASCLVQGACDEAQADACDHAIRVYGDDGLPPGIRPDQYVLPDRYRGGFIRRRDSRRGCQGEEQRQRDGLRGRQQRQGRLSDPRRPGRHLHGDGQPHGVQDVCGSRCGGEQRRADQRQGHARGRRHGGNDCGQGRLGYRSDAVDRRVNDDDRGADSEAAARDARRAVGCGAVPRGC